MPGTRLAWRYFPSRVLSGDLFKVAPWSPATLGCCILDASGRGVTAAARAAALARLLAREEVPGEVTGHDPGQILTILNQRCPLTVAGESFTVWLGTLSLTTGELRFSTAGHAGAAILRRNATVERVTRPSFPLGFVPGARYSTLTTVVGSGDRLLMFSDGIYDAISPTGERWGLDRVERALARHASLDLSEYLKAIIGDARAWQHRPRFQDDAALVGLEIG